MKASKSGRPRRSHTLGACRTCRRRHVKCDQKRPVCRTCRTLGVPCEGFTSEVRWIRDDGGSPEPEDHNGTRRHMYTEQSRLSMSTSLGSSLVSGSVSASLAEIDLRTRDSDRAPVGDIVVGPFAVLDFAPDAPPEMQKQPQGDGAEAEAEDPRSPPQNAPSHTVNPPETPLQPLPYINDSPSHIDDFLHWSDILGLSPEQPGFFQPSMADLDIYFGADPQSEAAINAFGVVDDVVGLQSNMAMMTPPRSAIEMASTFLDAAALADAPSLFKHFNETVVPQMMIMPLGEKTPWRILNLAAAMATYNDLTILGSQSISHARLANLYGLLACAASHLASNSRQTVASSSQHWEQAAHQMFEQAKDHMQKSLKYETREPKRAKYKDQLMAICCLIEYTVISGQHQHARSFMVNAELILRMRGLLKQRISQKARLLHHVYTWLRLVGESTYVLHDYNPSNSFIEALDVNFQRHRLDVAPRAEEPEPRLDDFLRLEAHDADSDLNINEPKDKQTGLHDIHLQDSRSFSDTLYKQIYGIPETWLSLVSQTTRLANAMETFRIAQRSGRNTSLAAWETLHRRSVRLENLICCCELSPTRTDPSKPHGHMLRALNAALVIFFYRRIRRVHPAIMAAHVDTAIASLAEFTSSLPPGQSTGPGAAWPAFIAGCEALTAPRRDSIARWLENAISTCGPAGFRAARDIMVELWQRQDEHLHTNRNDPMPTWIDFVREKQIWPLFC
ncbi:fungal-specific transcription factor domain-containing protein [Aspergillus pseudoustus]|uniref:Fungal-specific transcription factor domain-containing protein n=1 Tax=Aspergillus pseudoustus TaxID=1810923 RepID=A0ABR4JES6_9EURO